MDTAQLAQTVSCNTSLMLEGMHELRAVAPELVGKQRDKKWPVGSGVASDERVQILESDAARRQDFLDDLKSSFEWANKGASFTMNATDGKAVQKWLKENPKVARIDWKRALFNRYMSEGIVRAQAIAYWLPRLMEYRENPQDRFGKEMPHGIGGKIGQAIGVEQSNREAREAAVANVGYRRV